MKKIAVIPARYNSSRFPGKLMKDLGGKTVILRTYESTKNTNLFDDVFVVTNSDVIFQEIQNNGGKAILQKTEHETGTDRIAEVVGAMDVDIIVNVQGDVPFTQKKPLELLLSAFENDPKKETAVATLMQEMTDWEEIENPNNVKVITDKDDFALYFSRSPIPYPRDKNVGARYFEHIGIYAFRKQALIDFSKLAQLPNEASEKIECIRFLEYGMKIKMLETEYMGVEIDTEEDLQRAITYLNKNNQQ